MKGWSNLSISSLHIQLADETKRVFDDLKNRGEVIWALIAAFYSALHYVDAVLRNRNKNPKYHRPAKWAMRKFGQDPNSRLWLVKDELPGAYSPYKTLFTFSLNARYRPRYLSIYGPNEVKQANQKLQDVLNALQTDLAGI
jgi:hypothetical protein